MEDLIIIACVVLVPVLAFLVAVSQVAMFAGWGAGLAVAFMPVVLVWGWWSQNKRD